MREAEEEESQTATEPKQINNAATASLSDEELAAELRRRSESKAT
jgi:hypothetical protein